MIAGVHRGHAQTAHVLLDADAAVAAKAPR
jgi:hypothetical protein